MRQVFIAFLLIVLPLALRAETKHPYDVSDLASISRTISKENKILILLLSQPNCQYCDKIRADYFPYFAESPDFNKKIVIAEIMVGAKEPDIKDFNGEVTKPQKIADKYKANFFPIVLFLDAKGKELSERLLGLSSDLYGIELENSINKALAAQKK